MHGGQNSDVRANDVAFSLHCNLMTVLGIVQIILYNRGGQKVQDASSSLARSLHACTCPGMSSWVVACTHMPARLAPASLCLTKS